MTETKKNKLFMQEFFAFLFGLVVGNKAVPFFIHFGYLMIICILSVLLYLK